MSKKFIKLDNPCSEKWENMVPNAEGNFCHLCSKTVIDFTNLSPIEISKKLKQAGGSVCAKIKPQQLKTPLIDLDHKTSFRFPYANIAAGLMIATALTLGPAAQATLPVVQTEWIQHIGGDAAQPNNSIDAKIIDPINDTEGTLFKGKIIDGNTSKPVKNAKVMFISLDMVIATYTAEDGTFSLIIPSELIDDDNVIRVNYNSVKIDQDIEDENVNKIAYSHFYENSDYILSLEEMNSTYEITAYEELMLLGEIGYHDGPAKNPIVLEQGTSIKYDKFIKMLYSDNNNNLNSRYLYLEPSLGMALYGKKAQHGLYIIYDEPIP